MAGESRSGAFEASRFVTGAHGMARNPRTGTPVSIGAGYAPHFKPGMRLRQRVDQGLKISDPDVFADGR